MAEINRFEIGGIFYDCEDEDARNEIASLQRRSRLNYSQTESGGPLLIQSTTPIVIHTATKRVRVYVYVPGPYDESLTAARTMNVWINGQFITQAGGTSQYVGPWQMGNFDLWEGDVLSMSKAAEGFGANQVAWKVVPYYE